MTTVVAAFPPLLGYVPREYLAQGGQSIVYRALNEQHNHLAAIKVVPLSTSNGTSNPTATATGELSPAMQQKAKQLVREMRIHETLDHRNILKLFGGETRGACVVQTERGTETAWPTGLYMVLDLADGGDLFDKITPDIGVDQDIAHLYFRQLIAGLKYLNGHGICHRDVKPENCLVDGQGNLKISDFGLATVFKYKGQERLLKDRCGSPPYAAPELARAQPYAAEPIDVWSAGIVLFALLFGNTPWDEPTQNSPEFCAFLDGSIFAHDPWRRLGSSPDASAIAQLVLTILTVDPTRRPRLRDIERMDWYLQSNPLYDPVSGVVTDPTELVRRLMTTLQTHNYVGPPTDDFEEMITASQQPPQSQASMAFSQKMSQRGLDPKQSFRSSLQQYSKLSMAPTQRTNPNLARFFSTQPLPVLISLLTRVLADLDLPIPAGADPHRHPPFEVFYTTSESDSHANSKTPPTQDEIHSARIGRAFARIRIRTLDKRRENLHAAFHIVKSVLLSDAQGNSVSREEEATTRLEGFDINFYKRQADPLELKRLWREILKRMPEGTIAAL
ncbi:hypothetical protein JCM10908_002497 [Rhodotorula pacifica]|uniref:uncharacterized protein n=1 Tax=Rhodotorula pacifica TaxID=1495444 RepID=UPI00317A8A76